MVDNIHIFTKITLPLWNKEILPFEVEYNDLLFTARKRGGFIRFYEADDNYGLKHFIYPEEYQIRNSIHKAYSKMQGGFGNHTQFTFKELYKTVIFLCEKYNLNLAKTFIRKIEIGVNITLSKQPILYIEKLKTVQFTKEAENMRSKNRVYGKRIVLSQYHYKLYDKTFATKAIDKKQIEDSMLRFEMAFIRIEPLKKLVATLQDLIDYNKYIELQELLRKKYHELVFDTHYDLSSLTPIELKTYFAGVNAKYWKTLREYNKHTASTNRPKFNSIINKLEKNKCNEDHLMLELHYKVNKAINDII